MNADATSHWWICANRVLKLERHRGQIWATLQFISIIFFFHGMVKSLLSCFCWVSFQSVFRVRGSMHLINRSGGSKYLKGQLHEVDIFFTRSVLSECTLMELKNFCNKLKTLPAIFLYSTKKILYRNYFEFYSVDFLLFVILAGLKNHILKRQKTFWKPSEHLTGSTQDSANLTLSVSKTKIHLVKPSTQRSMHKKTLKEGYIDGSTKNLIQLYAYVHYFNYNIY